MDNSHDLVKFWKSICEGNVLDEGNFVEFQDKTVAWDSGTGISILYKRAIYDDIFEKVKSGSYEKMLILGTPGIGKSLLLMYLMYRLVRDSQVVKGKKKANAPPPPIPSFVYRNLDKESYFFHSDGENHVVEMLHESVMPDYYFSDTYAVSTAAARQCVVHVSSICNDTCRHYEKCVMQMEGADPPTGLIKHMSVLTFAEALEIAKTSGIDEEEMTFRYDVFGGNAWLLTSAILENQIYGNLQTLVANEMDSYFKDVHTNAGVPVKVAFGSRWEIIRELIVNECIHAACGSEFYAELTCKSMFQHMIVSDEVVIHGVWASGFMKSLGAAILEESSESGLTQLQNILSKSNSAFGAVFERCAHQKIFESLRARRKLPIQRLQENQCVAGGHLSQVVSRKVIIRSVEDISKLSVGDYGILDIPDFPLVGAIIKPNIILHMYAGDGPDHNSENLMETLQKIQKMLGGRCADHMMVFVINSENQQFRLQGDLLAVQQYALFLDMTIDTVPRESNVSKRRKK